MTMQQQIKSVISKGIFEFVLIFLGITLALAFENWNSDRERRQQERNLLTELYNDLVETQLDLETDIQGSQNRLSYSENLMSVLGTRDNGNLEDTTAFDRMLNICDTTGVFDPKNAAYESIKSIGLDLISNASIRTAAASLYEVSTHRVRRTEEVLENYILAYCYPYRINNFYYPDSSQLSEITLPRPYGNLTYISPTESAKPIDMEKTRNDPSLQMIVVAVHTFRSMLLGLYVNTNNEIDNLKSIIELELEL